MSKKLLTVFGATGNQGGSVISTILGNSTLSSQFALRGITRNTSSARAQALASKGVELAVADLNKPQEIEAALKGSYAVFAVTNYWESKSREIEVSQGKAIADACIAVGVKHAVFSSLPNVTKLTDGKLGHVAHFDGKSEIAEYFESVKGKTGMLSTYFMPGFYVTNFKTMIRANPQVNDGTPTLTLPWDSEKTHVPLLSPEVDTGTFVAGIVSYPEPKELDGKYIQGVSEWSTPSKIVSEIGAAIGKEVKFNPVPEDVFMKFLPSDTAEELTENMVLVRDYSYYGVGTEKKQGESDKVLQPLGLKTQSVTEWAKSGSWNF
ncbi:hypothetical protein H2198_002115 [Neophaeococcomyces mojaviensis]|uniref:Uncharacterized protein n=1 Tax=Neophaeococcomyces mojaviensis TaxID=3383035 RepID=A0ACC3AFZ2_9EURO|nr:hypothetical protein H2198_002115 [Knufia sp. JES_112]